MYLTNFRKPTLLHHWWIQVKLCYSFDSISR